MRKKHIRLTPYRTGSGRIWGALLLLWCLLAAGCGQRVHAEVSAIVEGGYQANGQSYVLELLPGFRPEDEASLQVVEAALIPALGDMGYVPAAPGTEPDVHVRVWWFSTGPHPVYRTVEWRDRGYGRHGRWGYGGYGPYGYRRRAVVVEDEYARFLVVEGVLFAAQRAGTPVGLSQSVRTAVDGFIAREWMVEGADPELPVARYARPPEQLSGVEAAEAARALPVAPAHLLWRVRVESRGNLSKAERLLPELSVAAAPYLGKSGLVQVLVQNGEIVAAEAAP